jgi:hypothetical protein
MSSDAREARRLRPDQRKKSKDHDISNHNYLSWDEQALHVDTSVAIAYSVGTLTGSISDTCKRSPWMLRQGNSPRRVGAQERKPGLHNLRSRVVLRHRRRSFEHISLLT